VNDAKAMRARAKLAAIASALDRGCPEPAAPRALRYGDAVAAVLRWTGVARLYKRVRPNCGCASRQARLNALGKNGAPELLYFALRGLTWPIRCCINAASRLRRGKAHHGSKAIHGGHCGPGNEGTRR
jgi:hypothetical protein